MKNLFLKITMLLFVLGMSVNAAWAINVSGMTDEEAETMAFWARLTAKPATTTDGSGKMYVVWDRNTDYDQSPADGDYSVQPSADGWSDIFLASSLINADAKYRAYAKADDGSYFTGWSFMDGYTDLGTQSSSFPVSVTPSATKAHGNYREYFLYAAFEKVKIASCEVSGDPTTYELVSEQTVVFRAETPGFFSALSSEEDVRHFKLPVITRKAGTTGTWSIGLDESNYTDYISFSGEYAEINVPVTFTAPNGDPGEYAATLTLETKAGVKMTAYVYARTTGTDGEAVRYNSSKELQEVGNLTTLLSHAVAGDIVKLNDAYYDPVEINKNITFDLNGYELGAALTVSGGNVTLAYSPYGGTISGDVAVTGGKLMLNGGIIDGEITVSAGATLEQNGAEITNTLTNNGTLTTTDGKCLGYVYSAGTLNVNGGYFRNDVDFDQPAITVTNGTAFINRGDIGGTDDEQCYYGVKATGGSVTVGKLASVRGEESALWNDGGSITVNGGKFFKPELLAQGTITFNAGYFKHKDTDDDTDVRGKQIWRNTAGPEAREGYAYFAGDQTAAQAANVSVCRIGHTSYSSLEDALAYANNHTGEEVIIIMENDYSLKAGYYTLPANATLIVPMSDKQETANRIVPRSTSGTPTPVSFRKLTFESGVNMELSGTIELTATQHGTGATMGIPGGNYGHLILKPGSHITIGNGGELRAWGFVTGDGSKDEEGNYLSGEIDARRGAVVREMFQMGDWKGGDVSLSMVMPMEPFSQYYEKYHLFPVYTYFIQNVESPVKYHPGASLICATSVNVAGSINAYANDIKVVGKEGEAAMFLMSEMADAENTWVRKYYDAKNDKQVYEVNSGAQLGSVVIDLGEVPIGMISSEMSGSMKIELDSRRFVLPLTNNFKIHLLTGYMEFTQSTSCLPGMEVEVDKEAEVAIIKNDDSSIVSGALYFYDADQWGQYVYNKKYGAIVNYSATWDLSTDGATVRPNVRNISSAAAIGDAILNVHGTFRMGANCAVYTTAGKTLLSGNQTNGTYTPDMSSGGGSIISRNEDAGTFIFDADAPAAANLEIVDGEPVSDGAGQLPPSVLANYDNSNNGVQIQTVLGSTAHVYGFEMCTSARLRNGDGTYANTYTDEDNHAQANDAYCYMNDRWTIMKVAEENGCFMKDNYGTFYAKPAEYVAVNATYDEVNHVVVGNDDHTFSDKDGTGRLFILMQDCQWWEVEKKDNLYHCLHPNNDTYYYWDNTENMWMEQRFTITWLNWDGEEIKSYVETGEGPQEVEYRVTYGTMAEYLGTNPTRDADIDYTYNFTGWSPALGKVTSDVTYTATYEKQERKYSIIFINEGGAEIERHLLTHNQMPACENVPTRTGFTLEWEPAIAAVIGDATYRATWLEEPPTEYQITFYDYDGTTVLKQSNVAVGSMPESPVIMDGIPSGSAGKPATSEFTYVFDYWSPALETVSVTSVKSYTAVYREVAVKYNVRFEDEDGNEIETNEYAYGETPVCSATPTKANTAEFTYSFAWTPQIQTVMGAATYRATFTSTRNKYTVTLRSNIPAACTFTSGAGTYDYGTAIAISRADNPGYTFVNWTDGETGEVVTVLPASVTKDISLVANFTINDPDYTISWMSEDGSVTLKTVGQKEGTTTTYTGAVPTKPSDEEHSYTFDGWTTEANGGGTFYLNGKTPKASADASYYAHFIAGPKEEPEPEPENLELDEKAEVSIDTPTEYTNLTITSDGVEFSSQIINAGNLTINGNADFVLQKSMERLHWYDVAVPWRVDAATGIFLNGSETPAGLGSDIDLYYYDGSVRAIYGKVDECWIPVKDQVEKVLEPGRAYLFILYNTGVTQVTFRKQAGASLLTTSTSVQQYDQSTGYDTDGGWNGIANPSLFKAYLNAGTSVAQTINAAGDGYEAIGADEYLVVGQPIYVQVSAPATVVADHNAYSAPVRRTNASAYPARYQLTITAEGDLKHSDRLFVQLDEEKELNTYVIGKDLAKFGTGTRSAQMWIDRYDAKLCLNTMAPQGEATYFPMSVSAPKAGEYTIAIEREAWTDEYELFLTYDGIAIWNLSESAYKATMTQGTDARYGLRISARSPQHYTGMDEAVVKAQGETRKVLVNDQVFIIRGEKVYTLDGQFVK